MSVLNLTVGAFIGWPWWAFLLTVEGMFIGVTVLLGVVVMVKEFSKAIAESKRHKERLQREAEKQRGVDVDDE